MLERWNFFFIKYYELHYNRSVDTLWWVGMISLLDNIILMGLSPSKVNVNFVALFT